LKNLKAINKKRWSKTLVIDLRDGGGYMEEAIDIADELLKDKQSFYQNKKGSIQKNMQLKGDFQTGKVFVLQMRIVLQRVKF
jgi:carboxyl-terminal processing protease